MNKLIILISLSLIIQGFLSNKTIAQNKNEIIIDSDYTFKEAVSGIEIPKLILKNLTIIDVEYFSFDGKLHKGQIVVNKSAAKDIKEIFQEIKKSKFPINKVIPAVRYDWSDKASMNNNNTSAFNYRKIAGQRVLSPHSYGLAIDINPMQNPHIKGKKIIPQNASYNQKAPGTILRDSQLVKEFQKRGWQWGGLWQSSRDYQHFEKK